MLAFHALVKFVRRQLLKVREPKFAQIDFFGTARR
jgi:hypothetical protein